MYLTRASVWPSLRSKRSGCSTRVSAIVRAGRGAGSARAITGRAAARDPRSSKAPSAAGKSAVRIDVHRRCGTAHPLDAEAARAIEWVRPDNRKTRRTFLARLSIEIGRRDTGEAAQFHSRAASVGGGLLMDARQERGLLIAATT